MKHWEQTLISPDSTLRDALDVIDKAGSQIALVVSPDRQLLGTLSDGDMRRALLRGVSLDDQVHTAMHRNPAVANHDEDLLSVVEQIRRLGLHQMPRVDGDNRVVGLTLLDDVMLVQPRDNWVVIMAGGLGTRLAELTRDTPKPMLKVGSRPLLETIVRGYADQGFRRFYFAVNYKSEQIEAHFGDGSALGIEVRYLREQQRMGTAGALSLLPERPTLPFIVTNADLLTKEDHCAMVDLHAESGADATMGVRPYEMQVPFGVVQEREGRIIGIEEKPTQVFTVSAGMYVLSPQVLELVPSGQFFDMPSLFDVMMREGLHTRCHRVDGYWLDIGQLPDYERAKVDFEKVFK
ncbi:nucleotidyltransferase family protein [Undibacterium sp. CY7W]|uniref:Nucleotidyltransferase family protein n=1 Tax=Undibacterium rugosum TaxID=2762291 RepID=A0A923I581_9BURK|nr:nucleotidyltransferase family protein [Undibacterium rugosum]MBC3936354.1 nucleotidyltransferase family protein [Undibacterium rugosum]